VTVGGVGFNQALATIEALAGRKSWATLALRTEDFKVGRHKAAIAPSRWRCIEAVCAAVSLPA
jgi:hypothetical protein